MHSRREILKNEICLDYQSVDLNFDTLVVNLVVICMKYECLKTDYSFSKIVQNEGKWLINVNEDPGRSLRQILI